MIQEIRHQGRQCQISYYLFDLNGDTVQPSVNCALYCMLVSIYGWTGLRQRQQTAEVC